MECAQSAAEGAHLGVYKYQASKTADKRSPEAELQLADGADGKNEWALGVTLANSQNWSRFLMDSPANLMTPTIFAKTVKDRFAGRNIDVIAHDKAWAEKQRMGSFLSVSQGSAEPPIFLEITYNGSSNAKDAPVCLIGKGITFDSGGISIKPCAQMDAMRADMGGGACVVGTIDALEKNKVPVNIKGRTQIFSQPFQTSTNQLLHLFTDGFRIDSFMRKFTKRSCNETRRCCIRHEW